MLASKHLRSLDAIGGQFAFFYPVIDCLPFDPEQLLYFRGAHPGVGRILSGVGFVEQFTQGRLMKVAWEVSVSCRKGLAEKDSNGSVDDIGNVLDRIALNRIGNGLQIFAQGTIPEHFFGIGGRILAQRDSQATHPFRAASIGELQRVLDELSMVRRHMLSFWLTVLK